MTLNIAATPAVASDLQTMSVMQGVVHHAISHASVLIAQVSVAVLNFLATISSPFEMASTSSDRSV
jgi:hypothetical protein